MPCPLAPGWCEAPLQPLHLIARASVLPEPDRLTRPGSAPGAIRRPLSISPRYPRPYHASARPAAADQGAREAGAIREADLIWPCPHHPQDVGLRAAEAEIFRHPADHRRLLVRRREQEDRPVRRAAHADDQVLDRRRMHQRRMHHDILRDGEGRMRRAFGERHMGRRRQDAAGPGAEQPGMRRRTLRPARDCREEGGEKAGGEESRHPGTRFLAEHVCLLASSGLYPGAVPAREGPRQPLQLVGFASTLIAPRVFRPERASTLAQPLH